MTVSSRTCLLFLFVISHFSYLLALRRQSKISFRDRRWLKSTVGVTEDHSSFIFRTSCFIEDTDAFGMVYNANYVKFYQRALESITHHRSILVRADRVKYGGSARLGSDLVIHSELCEIKEGISMWRQRICCGSNEINSAITSSTDNNVFYFSHSATPLLSSLPTREVHSEPITIWSDECRRGGGIDLISTLRYFERARTLALGGPAVLQKCSDAGYSIVVARYDNLELSPESFSLLPGDMVQVVSAIEIRGKSLVTFRHRCIKMTRPGEDEMPYEGLIATGDAVCVCVGANGRSTPFPSWILDTLVSH